VIPQGTQLENRMDSRSDDLKFTPGFLIAAGKSFRSGRLNIPLNVFIIPARSGLRFGASFGFNGKKRY
ncbi:MAG TPA: hypothetical protein VL947_01440, partial [Cytophagales bacterium]|nr:hypothetical protein [Cytophagales bacterium]